MPARRIPALALPVDPAAGVSFLGYEHRTPLLTIATGRPALLVTLTLPEHLEAGHVDFARQLAAKSLFGNSVAFDQMSTAVREFRWGGPEVGDPGDLPLLI